jgi:hypothetical protein
MKRRKAFATALVLLWAVTAARAQVRHEVAFPDLPGYRTLKCDFHAHTVFSDGTVWPTVRVDEAWREGLDAIAITDHIEYQPHRKDVPTNHNRPYELAAEAAKTKDLVLVKGAEITRETPPGHFNAVLLSDVNPLDTEDFYAVFDQAARQQAFVFWNHPGWQGAERGRWGDEQTRLFEKKQLHGIEICNGDSYYADAHRWALERNLTLLGNSDIHDPSLNSERTAEQHRTLTLVFARRKALEDVREALFAGRTAVWYRNRVIGRDSELAALFAACLEIDRPHHESGERVWVRIRNRCELDIELERIGQGRPARIVLPARATSLVRLEGPAQERSEGLSYRALNFLTGPDQPLAVKLAIGP